MSEKIAITVQPAIQLPGAKAQAKVATIGARRSRKVVSVTGTHAKPLRGPGAELALTQLLYRTPPFAELLHRGPSRRRAARNHSPYARLKNGAPHAHGTPTA